MNGNLNWMGNKVMEQGMARPSAKPAAPSVTMQQNRPLSTPQTDMTPAPTVPLDTPNMASMQDGGMMFDTQQGPPPANEKGYIPYYLTSNIGKNVRADFIIGTNQYVDKAGVLSEVGINYFVLYDVNSRASIMCDLYSVKFVTVLNT